MLLSNGYFPYIIYSTWTSGHSQCDILANVIVTHDVWHYLWKKGLPI